MNTREAIKKQMEELQKSLNGTIPTSNINLIDYEKIERDRQQREIMQSVERDSFRQSIIKANQQKVNSLYENIETIAQEIKKKEVSQVSNTTHINIGDVKDSNITNVVGNSNEVNSEFNKKFDELVKAINESNLQNKELIIQELKSKKDDKESLNKYLGVLLTRTAEITTIVTAAGALIGL